MASFTILDGGMGRELHRMGAPFKQPEWSALALMVAPETVERAHRRFVEAGAEVITTNSYALVPFHIGEAKFRAEGEKLADLAGRMARKATEGAKHPVQVAGSLPPLFGSYRPDLFDEAKAPAIIGPLIDGLSPHVDLWLAETQSALAEARFARKMLAEDKRPFWASFTLDDDNADLARPKLRSGECVAAAVTAMLDLGVDAVLFNCSQPEIMEGAVDAVRAVREAHGFKARIGIYANALPAAARGSRQRRPERHPRRPDASALPRVSEGVGAACRRHRRRLLRHRAGAHRRAQGAARVA